MASAQKHRRLSFSDSDDKDPTNMCDVLKGRMTEILAQRKDAEDDVKIVLQRLILIARLPHHLADKTEIGAHYERLNFQLNQQYPMDYMTGLLLIYPSCVLYIVESSRDVLLSVLRDLTEIQQQECALLKGSKFVFLEHNPKGRLFQQWSYKILRADQAERGTATKRLDEEEESTEMVCSVLSALEKLSDYMESSMKTVPGLVLDEAPELIIPQKKLEKLLTLEDLLTPKQYLQMYNIPLHINMDSGQVVRSSCLTTV